MDRNYSPFNPLDGWHTADGTPPYVVSALRELKDCICSSQPTIPQADAPVFSPISGGYELPFFIMITSGTDTAEIHYSLDGSDPDVTDPIYDPNNPITITQDSTIKAIAIAPGYRNSEISSATYTIEFPQAATPLFSPAQGDYSTSQLVTITSPNGGTIRYTLDGSAPTPSSTVYSGPIVVSDPSTTIRAIAIVEGFDNSEIANAVYTITPLVVATPTFSPSSGSFETSVDVTISCATPLAKIYYSLDGSDPDSSSFLYSAPITVFDTTTIKAKSFKSGYTESATATKTYTEATIAYGFYGTLFTPTAVAADINVGPVAMWQQTTTNYSNADSNYSYEETSLEIGTYRYYGVQDELAPASAIGGFFVSLNLSPSDFAQADEGYTLTDANGWPYYILALTFAQTSLPDGNYRVYRLLNELHGAFTMRVRQY
jgi:hypothetical protein